jgi:hypothetical protein
MLWPHALRLAGTTRQGDMLGDGAQNSSRETERQAGRSANLESADMAHSHRDQTHDILKFALPCTENICKASYGHRLNKYIRASGAGMPSWLQFNTSLFEGEPEIRSTVEIQPFPTDMHQFPQVCLTHSCPNSRSDPATEPSYEIVVHPDLHAPWNDGDHFMFGKSEQDLLYFPKLETDWNEPTTKPT